MKKLFYIFTVMTALFLVSCKEDETVTYANTAAQDAVGTYEGVWQEISSFTGDTTYATGRMTIETIGEEAYLCKVSIVNDSTDDWNTAAKAKHAVANVAHAGAYGDIVINNDGVNEMGNPFAGRVYGNGDAIFSCALASKIIITPEVGKPYKKNVIVAYFFQGKKVTE